MQKFGFISAVNSVEELEDLVTKNEMPANLTMVLHSTVGFPATLIQPTQTRQSGYIYTSIGDDLAGKIIRLIGLNKKTTIAKIITAIKSDK